MFAQIPLQNFMVSPIYYWRTRMFLMPWPTRYQGFSFHSLPLPTGMWKYDTHTKPVNIPVRAIVYEVHLTDTDMKNFNIPVSADKKEALVGFRLQKLLHAFKSRLLWKSGMVWKYSEFRATSVMASKYIFNPSANLDLHNRKRALVVFQNWSMRISIHQR